MLGQVDSAVADLHEAIRIKPDNANAYNWLGNVKYFQ